MEYQVTLLCTTNKYKPVSCIIKRKVAVDLADKAAKKIIIDDGIKKICYGRKWNGTDLKRFGYTKVKIREYHAEKIAQEKSDNYDLIKAMKYITGEWQRPSNAEV